MENWHSIENQGDIDLLFDTYNGFHDACMVSVSFQSGIFVDDGRAMHFGNAKDYKMSVIFQCQREPKTLELQFTGLRQMHLTGWQDNHLNMILDAYLSFHTGLLPGKPDRVIVWADSRSFDITKAGGALHEPSETYIVADALMWRIVA